MTCRKLQHVNTASMPVNPCHLSSAHRCHAAYPIGQTATDWRPLMSISSNSC